MKLNASVASMIVLAGMALSAQPALSQSATGAPGAPGAAPQSRMAPAPTAPTPANPNDASISTTRSNIRHGNAISADPGTSAPTPVPPANPNDSLVNTSHSNIRHSGQNRTVNPSTTEQKQEPSKAPLPSGYAYDANGRIGLVGK
jgi:hypothetical protein